ncbi:hypothetical protein N7478_008320 [Penicillium angulare]|uniref:uncharacterized protein n=1 Tax=Penicillium angulare TaxID=116970 RepID=UPI002541E88C|nr:uncharacterized protein N7478_008320 [Penicillium angulare]KAJ5273195.1 hypothetical protein N7478_008320 [Penicillium angulare]
MDLIRGEILQELAPEWLEESNNSNTSFCGNPMDLQRIYLQQPWTWGFFYRGIYKHDATSPFKLTGAAMASNCHYYYNIDDVPTLSLPLNPQKLILGTPKLNDPDPLINSRVLSLHGISNLLWWLGHEDDVSDPPLEYPLVIPMHERCWTLMTSLLGESLIKANLDTFLSANSATHIFPRISLNYDASWTEEEREQSHKNARVS